MIEEAEILYLDDEVILLDLYQEMIKHWGMKVDCFSDPKEALRQLSSRTQPYKVLLIDFHMPDTDGIEFIKVLYEKSLIKEAQIALFSSAVWDPGLNQQLQIKLPKLQKSIKLLDKALNRRDSLKGFLSNAI